MLPVGLMSLITAQFTKGTGAAANSMDWVARLGKTVLRILEIIKTERKRELVSFSGKKELSTQANGLMTNCKASALTSGLTAVHLLASGTTD